MSEFTLYKYFIIIIIIIVVVAAAAAAAAVVVVVVVIMEKGREKKRKKVIKNTASLVITELRSCVRKSRWPSWAPVPNKPTVSVDVKQHSTKL